MPSALTRSMAVLMAQKAPDRPTPALDIEHSIKFIHLSICMHVCVYACMYAYMHTQVACTCTVNVRVCVPAVDNNWVIAALLLPFDNLTNQINHTSS